MRRLLPPVLALTLAFGLTLPAQAGLGGLLRGAAKIGKLSKAAKLAKAGKLAKGASAMKGASALGAGVAAERVFAHVASDGARVGLFVADDGAGALKVVLQGGDELTHTPAGLRGLVDDFDAMAEINPDAGVDVFLDPGVLHRLDDLALGPNTRLWLANTEGASLPIRRGTDGTARVGVGSGRGPRLFFDVGTEAAKLALQLANYPVADSAIAVVDADCAAVPGALVSPDVTTALEAAEGTLVVFTDQPLDPDAMWRARALEVDLVYLGFEDVCPVDGPALPATTDAIRQVHGATTHADLWAIAATEVELQTTAELHEDWVSVRAAGLSAMHRVFAPPADPDDPPAWVYVLGLVIGIPVAFWYVRKQKQKPQELPA